MKKFFVLTGLFLIFCGAQMTFAVEQLDTVLKVSDVAVYGEDGNFGLKDKQGRIVVPAQYKKLIRVGNSSWIVQKKNKFGLIDSSGNVIIPPKYKHVNRILGKYVKFGNTNDYGLYDEEGNIIIPPEYSSIALLFGERFLTCKNYKYGITDNKGNQLLINVFDDIYMPNPKLLRVKFEGEWFEIEELENGNITMPEDTTKVKFNDKDFRITHLAVNTGLGAGYSALTATDYVLKLFSSVSPAYEQTIDELMFSQGADTVSIFVKLGWIPKFPFTYIQKYYETYRNPNNGPLSDIRTDVKKQIK